MPASRPCTKPPTAPRRQSDVHDEVRAIGSLSQAVVDQGIPAVLGMRYSVFVVTAAQYIGRVYSALAKGRGFGQAATEGHKDLHENPECWVGLQPRPLQDWFVPAVFEAARLQLFPSGTGFQPVNAGDDPHGLEAHATREKPRAAATQRDPIQNGSIDVKYVPDTGFIDRDETLLLLDRAFDTHSVVLLHGYAGQGKTTTAVEFARWYATTGGLGAQPNVLLTSFETTITLSDVLDKIRQAAVEDCSAINDIAEKQNKVLAVLRSVPLLWIWDNVEPVAGFPAGTESSWTDQEQRELADFLERIKVDKQSKSSDCILPTEDVAFGEVSDSRQTKHVNQLRAVVHAVCDDVSDGCAETFLLGRVIEVIVPQIVPRIGIGDAAGNGFQPVRGKVKSPNHAGYCLVCRPLESLF